MFVDFSGQSRWQNFEKSFKLGTDPMMLSPGIKIKTPIGLYITMAGETYVSEVLPKIPGKSINLTQIAAADSRKLSSG